MLVLLGLIVACAVGPALIGQTFDSMDLRSRLHGPTPGHWFGTDELGRDTLVRVMYGGQISLLVGFSVATSSFVVGGLIGAVSGYVGGPLDNVIMRVVDLSYSLPRILVLLVLSRLIGPGLLSIITILALLEWTDIARITRGTVLSVRTHAYVDTARSAGASDLRIVLRHVLPNALTPTIVAATFGAGAAIRAETTLSFLGLGIQPPTPSWGNLLSSASSYFFTAPWQVAFPGGAIFVALISFNLVGEGLRNLLDPREVSRSLARRKGVAP